MFTRIFCFYAFSLCLLANTAHAKEALTIAGWVEKVHIDTIGTTLAAKLDTGAKTTSLDAEIIKLIKPRDHTPYAHGYVVFGVEDDEGKSHVLKRKIHRWVRIKSKSGGFFRRPVVKMTFCIAGTSVTDEVNLSERGHFVYPVLIGRNMLTHGRLAVDASRIFTTKPHCSN